MTKDILIINASPRKDKNCFNISRDISKILEKEGVSSRPFRYLRNEHRLL